jgi:hypothetical protein
MFALLVGIFFLAVYESALTVSLFDSKRISDFDSIDDVLSCKINTKRVCFQDGGAGMTFWEQAVKSALDSSNCERPGKSISDNEDRGVFGPTTESFSILESRAGCDMYFANGGFTEWAVSGEFCRRLEQVGEPFYPMELSYVVPKGSPFLRLLNRETLYLRERGLLLAQTEYTKTQHSTCEPAPLDKSLSWEKLSVFFFVAYGILFIVFLLMIAYPGGKADVGVGNRKAENEELDGADGMRQEMQKPWFPSNSFGPAYPTCYRGP